MNSRDLRQQLALNRIIDKEVFAIFMAITGFGKTRVALMLIKHMLRNGLRRKTIVVVPTLPLKKQWQDKIAAWGLHDVIVDTVHSLIKHEQWCHLLILDEVHLYLKGEEFQKIMGTQRRWTLALSATLTDEELQILYKQGFALADTITRKEALLNKWVEEHDIFNVGIPFTRTEQAQYNDLSKMIYSHFERFEFDFGILGKVQRKEMIVGKYGTPVPALSYVSQLPINQGLSRNQLQGISFALSTNIRKRIKLMAEAQYKSEAMERIIKEFPNIYKMTFGATAKQADEYGSYGNPNSTLVYHSKKQRTKKQKAKALELFATGQIKLLSSVKALDQGFDEDFLQLGIDAGGIASSRTLIQRLGRIIRKSDFSYAAMVFFFMQNSKEESKIITAQGDMPVTTIRYADLVAHLKTKYGTH